MIQRKNENSEGNNHSEIARAKGVFFVCELKIAALTSYVLLKAQTLCLIKHAMAMEVIFIEIGRANKAVAEVRNLKLNIVNNARRNRDELINEVFDRRVARSNTNHQ